ncbi:MAG: helix-turn-helix transcriptional regulator [Phycisphaeraceae bacterium]|nr:helix-turn-helix transcriptional regulator [Phycisphaeraceae bacterium]MCB9848268.1 helix-turn-helix transcriptional regulator [Phycisphaeraceae bacterium]
MSAEDSSAIRLSPLEPLACAVEPDIPAPWSHTADTVRAWVENESACDSFSLWLVSLDNPAPDELMACWGLSAEAVSDWTLTGRGRDRLFQRALREGIAVGTAAAPQTQVLAGAPGAHVVYHLHPESLQRRRWWLVTLARSGQAYRPEELRSIELMARQWQAVFNRPAERGMHRLLIGADDRLIHADPATRRTLGRSGVSSGELCRTLSAVREQRWPEVGDGRPLDMTITIGKVPHWVALRRNRAAALREAAHWHAQLRPLEGANTLPAVEELADLRVARALAAIHDGFATAINLDAIAESAGLSPHHFHRLFTTVVGVSPKRYTTLKRMQAARWLLRTTRAPIGSIGVGVGYATAAHFASAFKGVVGVTPGEYRLGSG